VTSQIWKFYLVRLQFEGPFAAAIPKDPKEIRAILVGRLAAQAPPDATPADESAEPVTVDAGTDEQALPAWSTFKRDGKGLYYEGRCVRGHLKDCARQVAWMFPTISDFKARVSNATYVMTDKIYLGKAGIEGTETRFMRMGPQPAYRYVDYVVDPAMTFTLKLLNNGVIGRSTCGRFSSTGAPTAWARSAARGGAATSWSTWRT
jgi:hypothetical protein